MSQLLINAYHAELDRLAKFSGMRSEQVIRPAFRRLLDQWARSRELIFIEELEHLTPRKTKVYPDGTVLHALRVPMGYWEAKDTDDDLDVEITKKLAKGYPQNNIVFENSETAVLYQHRQEVMRAPMRDVDALGKLVALFFAYERPEIAEFRRAVEQFKQDLPAVLAALREQIDTAYAANAGFQASAAGFLAQAKKTINPAITEADVREMLIQHILTEEIFSYVFNDSDFHRDNNIAKALYELEAKFFTGAVKRDTLKAMEPYYAAIRATAAQITSHAEKQTFLKVIYENFYKVYNPKAADKLGVVYTPNEIVRFMIQGADWLCQKHFGKALLDKHVEILDPATGTGTFVCELLEYFRGDPGKLAHKYKNELHANEVAILPYYVANLNIEATYAAITGQYAEFPNLCFVDTLDNVEGLGIRAGHQHDLFGGMSAENVERIKRQNKRKISVIIGNPPYNANQQNENDNNKNRTYKRIDELIKSTYLAQSQAQKTKNYDMFSRFIRWASDRMHDDGVIAFVTNRALISRRNYDGFRKSISKEFHEIHVVDLGGDVRDNPTLSGTKHNVFGIQTGVAITFLVKKRRSDTGNIFYSRRPEMETAREKLHFLGGSTLASLKPHRLQPDVDGNWIDLAVNDWSAFLPIGNKLTKSSKNSGGERSIFKTFSLGVVTARDDWVIGLDDCDTTKKVKYLSSRFESDRVELSAKAKLDPNFNNFPSGIKWTRSLKNYLRNNTSVKFTPVFCDYHYRPFNILRIIFDKHWLEMPNLMGTFFGESGSTKNRSIIFSGPTGQKPFMVLCTDRVPDMHIVGAAAGGVVLPRFTSSDHERDNVTDWGLRQFERHYGKKAGITKDTIFNYVYAVLHDPLYRKTFEINLKREFPRIPFHPNFHAWVEWGRRLMELHVGFEMVEPWPLERLDTPDEKARAAGVSPRVILKADRAAGALTLGLSGISCVAGLVEHFRRQPC